MACKGGSKGKSQDDAKKGKNGKKPFPPKKGK